MGYRCRWIAVRGREREDVLSRLRFNVKTEHQEAVHDPGLYALQIGDWVVVIGDGSDHMDLIKREKVALLANRGEGLFFYTDDTSMKVELTSFVGGQRAWSFVYDGGSSEDPDAVVDGDTPNALKTRLAAARKQTAAEHPGKGKKRPRNAVDHIYSVPADAALELTGFRHDHTLGAGEALPIWELKPQ